MVDICLVVDVWCDDCSFIVLVYLFGGVAFRVSLLCQMAGVVFGLGFWWVFCEL